MGLFKRQHKIQSKENDWTVSEKLITQGWPTFKMAIVSAQSRLGR